MRVKAMYERTQFLLTAVAAAIEHLDNGEPNQARRSLEEARSSLRYLSFELEDEIDSKRL